MKRRFAGFPREMLTFFRGLEKNNRREWFAPRKELFETYVREPMVELVTLLNEEMRELAADHVADEPAKAIYRIYRDTRFSKDKTPYKTHIAATFHHRSLPRHGGGGFYFEVSHQSVGVGGGVYLPGPEELQAVRAAMAADPKGFLKIMEDRGLRKLYGPVQGEKLARLPKAWQGEAGAPVAEYLKFKQLYWYVDLPVELALTGRVAGVLMRHFQAMAEGIGWMNRVILEDRGRRAEEERPVRPPPMW